MVKKLGKECRLCLKTVNEYNYTLMDKIHKEMLDVLLINININKSGASVMCNDCLKKLQDSFSFKATCFYTEDHIHPFLGVDKNRKIDIAKVYVKVNNDQTVLLQKQEICRFCMKIIKKITFFPLKNLNEPYLEMLKKYIPELHLEATKDPVICETCFNCLVDYFGFVEDCLNAVQKERMTPNGKVNVTYLKTRDFEEDCEDDSNIPKLRNEKTSASAVVDASFIKNGRRERSSKEAAKNSKRKHKDQLSLKRKKTRVVHKCDQCDFKTLHRGSLRTHSLRHKGPAYSCDHCPFRTIYKQSFEKHKASHENNGFLLKIHNCPICNFRTRNARYLKTHMIVHETSSNCQLYQCDKCAFKTKHRLSLKSHKLIHEDVPLLACPLCTYRTKHKRTLEAHKLTHNKDKTYTCGECGFQTSQKPYLSKHMQTHQEKRLNEIYQCEKCPYKTTLIKTFKSHSLIHQQPSKMFKCEVCLFVTRYKGSLERHMMQYHVDKSQSLLHKCESCDFETKYKFCLTKHRLLHKRPNESTLFKCEMCEYQAKSRSSVRWHQVQTHVNPSRKFECYNCDFITNNKGVLRNHVVLHMDPSRVVLEKCKLCSYQTRHKRSIASHVKLMHKDKV